MSAASVAEVLILTDLNSLFIEVTCGLWHTLTTKEHLTFIFVISTMGALRSKNTSPHTNLQTIQNTNLADRSINTKPLVYLVEFAEVEAIEMPSVKSAIKT